MLLPVLFIVFLALCVSRKSRENKKDNAQNGTTAEEGDVEAGANTSSVTLIPGEASGNRDNKKSNNEKNKNKKGNIKDNKKSTAKGATAAAGGAPQNGSTGVSEELLRRYSDLPTRATMSIEDSEFGGFLSLSDLPSTVFSSVLTNFSAFNDLIKPTQAGANDFVVSDGTEFGPSSPSPLTANSALLEAMDGTDKMLESLGLLSMLRPSINAGLSSAEPVGMDYEYVSSGVGEGAMGTGPLASGKKTGGPIVAEEAPFYSNATDYPRSTVKSQGDASPARGNGMSQPRFTSRMSSSSIISTGSVFSDDVADDDAGSAEPRIQAASLSEEVYVDLSNDPLAQRAARNSVSFVQQSIALANARSAASTKTSGRPATIHESSELYVNMRDAHSAFQSSTLPSSKTKIARNADAYEDMTDANVPKEPETTATSPYKIITSPDMGNKRSNEVYVDMQANNFFVKEDNNKARSNTTPTASTNGHPPAFIPPSSGSKLASNVHSYVNTKDGVTSLPAHTYVNTAPAVANESSTKAEYGNVPSRQVSASATTTPLVVATITQSDQYSYNNAAISSRPAGSMAASDDMFYVNNEASRKQFVETGLKLSRSLTTTSTSSAIFPAGSDFIDSNTSAQIHKVVAVPSEFYINLMQGRPANERWHVAPMDTGRFKALSQNKQPQSVVPEIVCNKKYNRHLDVLPNPTTRVPLSAVPGDATSTYINANFVRDGSGNAHAYICTQAPQELTITHFWRMIWEHNVPIVIMATGLMEKGEEKSQQYWPDKVATTLYFLDIAVTLVASRACNGYTCNTLRVESRGDTRQVTHWWFTAWPDHGVPRANGKPDASQCVEMLQEIRKARKTLPASGPTLVHCSAGVGRSGSLIAMDVCMSLLEETGHVDVCYVVYMIRHDRVALVQHPQQYELVHAACHFFARLRGKDCEDNASAIMQYE